jgi:hypothetical protein
MNIARFAALLTAPVVASVGLVSGANAGTETKVNDHIGGQAAYGVESSASLTEVEAQAEDGYARSEVGGQAGAGQTLNVMPSGDGASIDFGSGVSAESVGTGYAEGSNTRASIYQEATNTQKVIRGHGSHEYEENTYDSF